MSNDNILFYKNYSLVYGNFFKQWEKLLLKILQKKINKSFKLYDRNKGVLHGVQKAHTVSALLVITR